MYKCTWRGKGADDEGLVVRTNFAWMLCVELSSVSGAQQPTHQISAGEVQHFDLKLRN